MNRYSCGKGMALVSAETMNDAAQVFARRMARHKWGKLGDCRTLNCTGQSEDTMLGEYSAFIGYSYAGSNETTGHNVSFTVRRIA